MSKAAASSQPGTNTANSTVPDDDVLNPKFGVSCLDFLLIELVPLAQRITERLHARDQALREEFERSKIFHKPTSAAANVSTDPAQASKDAGAATAASGALAKDSTPSVTGTTSTTATTSTAATATTVATAKTAGDATSTSTTIPGTNIPSDLGLTPLMDDETRDAVFWRLDGLGYRVGQGLVERFSAGKSRPTSALDAIKFVCKDLWTLVWRKQIDNLKTNHRGVFVLTDARFQALSRMSVDQRAGARAGEEALRRAQSYLYFPCGVIRGALAGLGVEATVTAESTEIPVATFQIKTKGAKA